MMFSPFLLCKWAKKSLWKAFIALERLQGQQNEILGTTGSASCEEFCVHSVPYFICPL